MKPNIKACMESRAQPHLKSGLQSYGRELKQSIHTYLILGVLLGVYGCTDIKGPTVPAIDDSDAFASLNFTTEVAFIQEGDTLPIRLIATAADGTDIPVNTDSIHWSSTDSSLVHVDTLGRIVGRGVTQAPVEVVASYRHSFTTRIDTLKVYVTSDEFRASTVRITVIDSTRIGTGANSGGVMPRIKVDLLDGNGDILNNDILPLYKPESIILKYVKTGGPSGEPVYFVDSKGIFLGKFWIKASFNFYGVEVRDSVEFTGTHRYTLGTIQVVELIDGSFSVSGSDGAARISIQPCAVISFALQVRHQNVDLVFSDSSAAPDGCEPLSDAALGVAIYLGDQYKGDFIGGNLLNIQPGLSYYFRRSNSKGEMNWHVRDAATKEPIPIGGRFQVIDVD